MTEVFTWGKLATGMEDAKDVRVSRDKRELNKIKAQIEATVNAGASLAMREVWERLHVVVTHMADRLAAYKPAPEKGGKIENPFRDSTVDNVREMLRILPALNITDDQELTDKLALIETKLVAVDPAKLRADPKARAKAAASAKEIADSMAGRM